MITESNIFVWLGSGNNSNIFLGVLVGEPSARQGSKGTELLVSVRFLTKGLGFLKTVWGQPRKGSNPLPSVIYKRQIVSCKLPFL